VAGLGIGIDLTKSFLIKVTGSVLGAAALGLFDNTYDLGDLPLPIRKLTVHWDLGASDETGVCTCHYINSTSGDIDDSWDAADFLAVEDAWIAFVAGWQGYLYSGTGITGFTWHHPEIHVPASGPNTERVGDPVRQITRTAYGTSATGHFAQQVASAVTLKTPQRRHWGRFYLPGPDSTYISATGQYTDAYTAAVASAAQTLVKTPKSSRGVMPVVLGLQSRTVRGVNAVQCDSVPDIIRRRRPATTAFRHSLETLA
jgi:hypothetical protein